MKGDEIALKTIREMVLTGFFLSLVFVLKTIFKDIDLINGYSPQIQMIAFIFGIVFLKGYYKLGFYFFTPCALLLFGIKGHVFFDYLLPYWGFFLFLFVKKDSNKVLLNIIIVIFSIISFLILSFSYTISGVVLYKFTWEASAIWNFPVGMYSCLIVTAIVLIILNSLIVIFKQYDVKHDKKIIKRKKIIIENIFKGYIMKLKRSPRNKINGDLIIGFFDGLHYGHQKLFNVNPKATLLTFPAIPRKPNTIYSFKQKINDLSELPFKQILIYKINTSHNLTAEKFIKEYLLNKNISRIIIGSSFKFGSDLQGPEILKKYFKCVVIDEDEYSTTKNKKLLKKTLLEINSQLIKNYHISATVEHGLKKGRELGYPTVNFYQQNQLIYLTDGVYETRTIYNDKEYNSITFIGKSEIFLQKKGTIETYIFDFDKKIYGKYIDIIFIKRVGDVIQFTNIENLILHIESCIKKIKD